MGKYYVETSGWVDISSKVLVLEFLPMMFVGILLVMFLVHEK